MAGSLIRLTGCMAEHSVALIASFTAVFFNLQPGDDDGRRKVRS